jgi:CheY-like chemotaxis protein
MGRSVAFTEPEPASRRNALAPCDLHQMIGRALDGAAERSANRGTSVTLRLDEGLRAGRLANARLAETAISRLADAAMAAGHGRVSILGAAEGGDVRLEVFSGQGRESRCSEAAIRAASLAADELDGRLVLSPPREPLAWSMVFPAPLARPKVLAIDDDPTARIELAAALDAAGFAPEVHASRDAMAAVWSGGPYACVLIELYLEDADALQIAAISGAPAFALSTGHHQVSRWALRQAGFHGLFVKPARMDR